MMTCAPWHEYKQLALEVEYKVSSLFIGIAIEKETLVQKSKHMEIDVLIVCTGS